MSQVSLYMDESTMGLLRDRSEKERTSISKYVAQIVKDHVGGNQDSWPAGFWESVYGCLSDEDADAMFAAVGDSSSLNDALDDDCNWFAESGASDVSA